MENININRREAMHLIEIAKFDHKAAIFGTQDPATHLYLHRCHGSKIEAKIEKNILTITEHDFHEDGTESEYKPVTQYVIHFNISKLAPSFDAWNRHFLDEAYNTHLRRIADIELLRVLRYLRAGF